MPPAIGAIVAVAEWVGAGIAAAGAAVGGAIGVSATAGTLLVVNGIIMGAEYGISKALAPSLGKVTQDPGSNQVNVRQPISYRQTIYGEVRTGGVITYIGLSGSKNEYLHFVLTLAGHKLHALHQNGKIYINGEPYDVSTNVGGKYAGFMWVYSDLGDPANSSQPFPELAADCPNWTSSCLQRGCAKVHIKMKWDQDVFSNGVPVITFDVQGKEVYDPRTEQTAFTSNPALLLRDYLISPQGMRVQESDIDDDACIAAANICDEPMVLREGGTQARYEANGVLTSDQQRGDIIKSLAGAMMGFVVPPSDAWRMFAGAYRTPVMDITDSDLRSTIKMDTRVSRRDLCNGVRGTYISDANNWQPSDFPAYQSATYLTEDGNEPLWTDVAFDLETDPIRAQRLAKIMVEQARRKRPLTLPCKLRAFPLEPGDTIRFTHTRWGLNNATYLVSQAALTTDGTNDAPVLGCDLVLYPIDASQYAWDPNVDEGTVTPVGVPLLPDSSDVKPVTGMALLSDETTTIFRADGIAHTQIKVTWTPPADQMVQSGGNIEVLVSKAGGQYRLDGYAAGNDHEYYISNNIIDGAQYYVKLVAVNASGAHSAAVEQFVTASSVHSIISGDGIVLSDGGTLNDVPQNVTIIQVTESPFKTDSGQMRSLVAVSYNKAVGDDYFYKAKVYFTGYHGSSTPEFMGEGTVSPISFLCDTTHEDVTVTVVSVRNNGNETPFATSPTATVSLDGVVSVPPAPSVASAQVATPNNDGWTGAINVIRGLEHDLVSGYWMYRTDDDTPPTSTAQRVKFYSQPASNIGQFTWVDTTDDIYRYWFSAEGVGTGYESDLTLVPFTYVDPNDPAPPIPSPVNITKTYQPTLLINGWGANGHAGNYEGGGGLGTEVWGLNGDTTYAYTSPNSAYDGNETTSASYSASHTHRYAGCIWTFSGITLPPNSTVTAVSLKVLSESKATAAYAGHADLWYSLNNGSTWTKLYAAYNARTKRYDTIPIGTSQDMAQIQVMAFADSHDNVAHLVYGMNLEISMNTSNAPEKVAGAAAKLV